MTTHAGPRNRTYYAGDLRSELVAAAIRAAAESGPSEVSLRAIARELGVSHAAPNNHFRDRRALLTAVAAEAHRRLLGYFRDASDGTDAAGDGDATDGGDPLDEVEAMGRAYLAFARAERGCFAVMWREDLQDRADPSLREASAATLAVIVELAGRVAGTRPKGRRGGGSRGATAERDPAVVAALLWSAAHGFADLSRYGALDDLVGGAGVGDDAFLALLRSLFAGPSRAGAT
ncbi:MAG: TetR/AcrR family transcriptional regulator [Phycicoccus sp.]